MYSYYLYAAAAVVIFISMVMEFAGRADRTNIIAYMIALVVAVGLFELRRRQATRMLQNHDQREQASANTSDRNSTPEASEKTLD
jgi:hypothetical protein